MFSFQIIEYIVRQFFAFIVYAFCYITNPIVVLFCDEYGILPKYFKLWQTYDNCLDIEWLISENVYLRFSGMILINTISITLKKNLTGS